MSTLAVNTITTQTGTDITLASGRKLVGSEGGIIAPGMIIDVQQVVVTSATSSSIGGLWQNVPGMEISITPKSSSNKILLMVDAKFSHTPDSSVVRGRVTRDGTAIYIGDAAGNRPRASSAQYYVSNGGNGGHFVGAAVVQYLDSPNTTNQVTYRFQYGSDSDSSHTVHFNRTNNDRDSTHYDSRTASSITVMEIAG